jgi:hypothetical protein
MPDLNDSTVEFLYALLKAQQARAARSVGRASFSKQQDALDKLRHRFLLELSYGENAGDSH